METERGTRTRPERRPGRPPVPTPGPRPGQRVEREATDPSRPRPRPARPVLPPAPQIVESRRGPGQGTGGVGGLEGPGWGPLGRRVSTPVVVVGVVGGVGLDAGGPTTGAGAVTETPVAPVAPPPGLGTEVEEGLGTRVGVVVASETTPGVGVPRTGLSTGEHGVRTLVRPQPPRNQDPSTLICPTRPSTPDSRTTPTTPLPIPLL